MLWRWAHNIIQSKDVGSTNQLLIGFDKIAIEGETASSRRGWPLIRLMHDYREGMYRLIINECAITFRRPLEMVAGLDQNRYSLSRHIAE